MSLSIQATRGMICKYPHGNKQILQSDIIHSVYRVRPSSPDNKPLLVPFYKTGQQSNFPYRNALISSLPQKSDLDSTAVKVTEIPGLQTPYSGEIPASNMGAALAFAKKPSDSSSKKESLQRVLIGTSSQPAVGHLPTIFQRAPADGAGDTTAPNSEHEGEGTLPISTDLESFGRTGRIQSEDRSNMPQDVAIHGQGFPESGAKTSGVNQHAQGLGLQYPARPSQDSVPSEYSAHNLTPDEALRLTPTESVQRTLESYRRNLYSQRVVSRHSVPRENARPLSQMPAEFLPKNVLGEDMASGGSANRAGGLRPISFGPVTRPPHPTSLVQESLHQLECIRSRLESIEVPEEDAPVGASVRQFWPPPLLAKKSSQERLAEVIPDLPRNHKDADPELVKLQNRYSRGLFFMCCLFPPLLIILAVGGMDELMPSFTGCRVDRVSIFYKRLASAVGALVGAMCLCVPISMGVLLAKGLL